MPEKTQDPKQTPAPSLNRNAGALLRSLLCLTLIVALTLGAIVVVLYRNEGQLVRQIAQLQSELEASRRDVAILQGQLAAMKDALQASFRALEFYR